MGLKVRSPKVVSPICSKAEDGRHFFVREVRDAKGLGMKQDRMLCSRCRVVLYPWGRPFKPNPQEVH